MTEQYRKRMLETTLDLRENGIRGEASVFNQFSHDLGGFTEVIDRGAFDSADMSDIVALFNHDRSMVLGRTSNDTLKVSIDESGLQYEIGEQVTSFGRDIEALVKRGDISKSSFGFTLREDGSSWEYDERGKVIHRVLANGIKRVWDVSPVTFPAYPQTNARDMEKAKEFFQKAQKERAESQQKLDAMQEACDILRKINGRTRRLQLMELEQAIEKTNL
jgi:HK97 family phage prohead protease